MVLMYNMESIRVPKLAIDYCFFIYHFVNLNIGHLYLILGTRQLADLLKNINKTVGKFT